MKKILQIAKYDFKRIALNPITFLGFAVVMIVCMILGFAYKIPNTPAYSAKLAGQTTIEVYQSFLSNDSRYDTKSKLDEIFLDAQNLIDVHNQECLQTKELTEINSTFEDIWEEVNGYNLIGDCIYKSNITPIITASNNLASFINDFKKLEQFHSRLVITNEQMTALDEISEFFKNTLENSQNNDEALRALFVGKPYFDALSTITTKAFTFNVDSIHLSNFTKNYIDRAEEKLTQIYQEMTIIGENAEVSDTKLIDKIKSLATNYKLTCESVKKAIINEYKLLMDSLSIKINKLYGYEKFSLEETNLELSLCKYYLQDDGLYYTQHQQALNFNSASYKTTAYDHAYFIMSIVGFLTVLFGIFTAYKLFGLDKRNGKMDLILSQKVSFNQVFTGKFLALLWSTSYCLLVFGVITFVWGAIFYGFLPSNILTVFNLNTVYTISPFLFLLIKLIGIELQAIFYSVLTVFAMNISRKFELTFAITIGVFLIATICNIFLNSQLWYCLLPFIHADITSFLGGATMQTGFLKTSLYAYGNFFISLIYYIVVVGLLYTFTKHLFRKH